MCKLLLKTEENVECPLKLHVVMHHEHDNCMCRPRAANAHRNVHRPRRLRRLGVSVSKCIHHCNRCFANPALAMCRFKVAFTNA